MAVELVELSIAGLSPPSEKHIENPHCLNLLTVYFVPQKIIAIVTYVTEI
jgi:hypothetical protein